MQNNLTKKFIGFFLGPFFSAFLGFIITPITTKYLSPDDFGKASMYTLAITLVTLIIFLGMDQAFVREYNCTINKKILLFNAILIPLILSIISVILCVMFSSFISKSLFDRQGPLVIYMLSFSVILTVVQRFNLLIIRMEQKAFLYSLMIILDKIINIIVLLSLLNSFENKFLLVIIAQFFSLMITTIICFIINYKNWKFNFVVDKKLATSLFKFGLPLVPTVILSWMLASMDRIAIRNWSDFYQLGLYAIAFKIVTALDIIKTSFSTFWVPVSYKWYEENVEEEKFLLVSEKLMSILTISFTFVVLTKDILIRIFDERYFEASKSVPFLLFIPAMYTIAETTKIGISFKRKTYFNLLVMFIAAITNLVGNIILVPILGSVGAAISTAFSYIIYFITSTIISNRIWIKFNILFYIVNICMLCILCTISVFFNSPGFLLVTVFFILYFNSSNLKYVIVNMKNYFFRLLNKV